MCSWWLAKFDVGQWLDSSLGRRAELARLSEMLIVLVSFGQTTDEATTVCCVCLVLVRLVQAWLALLERGHLSQIDLV